MDSRTSVVLQEIKELIVESKRTESDITLNDEKNLSLMKALKKCYQSYDVLKSLLSSHTQSIADINLSVIETYQEKKENKESQKSQESKKSENKETTFHSDALTEYEREYNVTESIDVKDIFNAKSKKEESQSRHQKPIKRLLILGRAGIGKSTMSQYFAYEWSQGKLWQNQFDYVFLIPLRNLTQPYYRERKNLSIASIIQSECIKNEDKEIHNDIEKLLSNKSKRLLFILDGYDEVAEVLNQGIVLSRTLKKLLTQEQVILTSRPYHLQDTHLFDRQLENMGFTDQNIEHYVKNYFITLKDEKQSDICLNFLKNHPSLWGSAHVPINLALITETWQQAQEEKNTEKQQLNHQDEKAKNPSIDIGLTQLYYDITHYFIKRHLEKQNKGQTRSRSPVWLYQQVNPEMAYLEKIAFDGLKTLSVNLEPKLQKEVQEAVEKEWKEEKKQSLFDRVLQLGFLRTIGADETEEINKGHYFIHLTFQEFFAARYLINGLKQPTDSKHYKDTLQFLRDEKYNPRYQIVLGFMAGLLSAEPECIVQQEEKQDKPKKTGKKIPTLHLFWNTLLSPPLDMYGAGHLRLIMRCLEEAQCDSQISMRNIMLRDIRQWFKTVIYDIESYYKNHSLIHLLSVFPRVFHASDCLGVALQIFHDEDKYLRRRAVQVLGNLGGEFANEKWVGMLLQALKDEDKEVQKNAAFALGKVGGNGGSETVVMALLDALRDKESSVRKKAAEGLGNLGGESVSKKMLTVLLQALENKDEQIRIMVVELLGTLGEKAASENVVTGLLQALLRDEKKDVRREVAFALGSLGKKVASENVVAELLKAEGDTDKDVGVIATRALEKLGEKSASAKVVVELLQNLKNDEGWDRRNAVERLGNLGEKAGSKEVVAALLQALGNSEYKERMVRSAAAAALGKLGKKAASKEVVDALLQALEDYCEHVRESAAGALGKLGEKAASEKVVVGLMTRILEDDHDRVRAGAAWALRNLTDKPTNEKMVAVLLKALKDDEYKSMRVGAAQALGILGEKTATDEVVAALLKALADKNESVVREKIVEALGKLGEKAANEEVGLALAQALRDKEHQVRWNAAKALVNLGEKAISEKVVNALLEVRGDESLGVRESVMEALGKLDKKAVSEKVVTALLEGLEDTNGEVEIIAKKALEGLCSVAQLIQLYPKLAQYKGYSKFLRKRTFKNAVTISFDSCLVVWEGQKKSIVKNISKDQIRELAEWLTVTIDNQHLPTFHLSYGLSLDISINKRQNSNPVFISELYAKQAVKIQLNYSHDACKKGPCDVLSTALKTLDHEHLQYLDLSDNRLTDEVAATLAIRYIAKGAWPNLRTLKLSNNQLSLKGLWYLLQELSENSSLKFLDVDQNRIACEAKQFQEQLEPLIKKAQLERLDLSMNFIEKGGLLTVSNQVSLLGGSSKEEKVKTISYKAVYDKDTLVQKIGNTSRLYCKSFFFNNAFKVRSTIQNTNTDDSTKSKSVLSLLNLSQQESKEPLEINKSHGVVALFANKSPHFFDGQHAFLVLEYLHTFGQRSIVTGDLFYNEKTKKISIRVAHVSPQEFLNRIRDGDSVYSNIARVEKQYIKNMIKKMLESRDRQDFSKYAKIFTRNGVYNCLTWAVDILKEAEIIKDVSHWRPSDNVGRSYDINNQGCKGSCVVM